MMKMSDGSSLEKRRGPFRADQVRDGDRYELSDGNPVYCAPSGGRHGNKSVTGATALSSDPAVEQAGVDTGYKSHDLATLRAPDIAIGNVPDEPGWVRGAPPLAVEYADTGQDEDALSARIADLLRAGTKIIWVVRLVKPQRVEIHEPGLDIREVGMDDDLTAPGILQNPVPVRALFERDAAHEVTLRNLLQRRGYDGLDAVKAEGRAEGRAEGKATAILQILRARGLAVNSATERTISSCADHDLLDAWLERALSAERSADVVA